MTPRFYLSSYTPLACTRKGLAIATAHGLPPLIDGSPRREPDLVHPFPAITSLRHGMMLVPKLKKRDVVGYVTTATKQLTALLRVIEVLSTHEDGASWYRERALPLPTNCVVEGNEPESLYQAHRPREMYKSKSKDFSAFYKARIARHSVFVICDALYRHLNEDAPQLTTEAMERVFGGVVQLASPSAHSIANGWQLAEELGLEVNW